MPQYSIVRLDDPTKLAHSFEAAGPEEAQHYLETHTPLVDWLQKNDIPWLEKDAKVWRGILRRVAAETYIDHVMVPSRRDGTGSKYRERHTPNIHRLNMYLESTRKFSTTFGLEYVWARNEQERYSYYFDPVTRVRIHRHFLRMEATVKSPPFKMDEPRDDYGNEVGGILDSALQEAMQDCDYCDNTRWALMSNTFQMKQWKRAKNSGCCGSIDEVIEINGEKYIYGFNHGH